jgi:hypothetical protein
MFNLMTQNWWTIAMRGLVNGIFAIAIAFKLRSLRRPGGELPHVGHAAPSH